MSRPESTGPELIRNVFLVALLLAGCGGSSGPPPPEKIFATLVDVGFADAFVAPPAAGGYIAIRSMADLAKISEQGVGPDPVITSMDFNTRMGLYLEGVANLDPGSVVRLVEVLKIDNNVVQVTAEQCGSGAGASPSQRPFAVYTLPALTGSFMVQWRVVAAEQCTTVQPVAATLVTSGTHSDFDANPLPFSSAALRHQDDLDPVLPALPALPAEYRAPDFSRLTLVLLNHISAYEPTDYVRAYRVYANPDGSRDIMVEYCLTATPPQNVPRYKPFALYAVPAFTGDYRFTYTYTVDISGACVTMP